MKIGMQEITVEGIGTRLSVSLRGPTAVVRLFNPPHGCMDEPMEAELTLALTYLEQCTLIRVVILAGRDPGMFVRHYDMAVPARACANIKYLVRNAGCWNTSEGMDAERTLLCDCMVDPSDVPLSAWPRPGLHQSTSG